MQVRCLRTKPNRQRDCPQVPRQQICAHAVALAATPTNLNAIRVPSFCVYARRISNTVSGSRSRAFLTAAASTPEKPHISNQAQHLRLCLPIICGAKQCHIHSLRLRLGLQHIRKNCVERFHHARSRKPACKFPPLPS